MDKILPFLLKYKALIVLFMGITLTVIIVTIFLELIKALKKIFAEIKQEKEKEGLSSNEIQAEKIKYKGSVLRRLVSSDAIDPGPNGYLKIINGEKEIFARSFIISEMPNVIEFAVTFADLMNYSNCTSSFYVHPLASSAVRAKLDRYNTVLDAEYYITKNSNEKRRIANNKVNAERLAADVEAGNTKLFDVGAVFTFFGRSIEELNKLCELFRSIAKSHGITISNRYGLEAEAFLANAPLNHYMGKSTEETGIRKITHSSPLKYKWMDKYTVSALYNYTLSTFSHKNGILLGMDLFTGTPVIYNIFDPSHDAFNGALFGGMGAGKSATIKIMCIRNRIFGYRYASIDGQKVRGTGKGEYAALAVKLGGFNFGLSSKPGSEYKDNTLNIFEVSESVESVAVRSGKYDRVEEKTSLNLAPSKNYITSTLLRMVQGTKQITDVTLYTYLRKVITNAVTKLYDKYEIYDGKPASLYRKVEDDEVIDAVTSGFVRKEMPTLTEFYKLLVTESIRNTDRSLVDAYNLALAALSDYVREIYYSERTGTFFSASEYRNLPEIIINGKSEKVYKSRLGEEGIVVVRGTRVYFDGQSTVNTDLRTCPFLNIDISDLQEDEKPIARIIAMGFLNEKVIKKNSENIDASNKLLLIVDEFHEIIKDGMEVGETGGDGSSVLDLIENTLRTGRKRNVGLLLCSQTVREFVVNPKSEGIISLLSYALIFKQSINDREIVKKTFGLTDSQAGIIVDYIGGKGDDEATKFAHRGEACLVDTKGSKVCFLKVSYFKSVEDKVVETDSVELERIFGRPNKGA